MSVLKSKRSTSKAEFVNMASQIYDETIDFLTRLSARYSRLMAEAIASLAGEVEDHAEKQTAFSRLIPSGWSYAGRTSWRPGPPLWPWTCGSPSATA